MYSIVLSDENRIACSMFASTSVGYKCFISYLTYFYTTSDISSRRQAAKSGLVHYQPHTTGPKSPILNWTCMNIHACFVINLIIYQIMRGII